MFVDLFVALVDRSEPTAIIEMLYSSNGRKQVLFCPEFRSEAHGGRYKKMIERPSRGKQPIMRLDFINDDVTAD